MNEQDKETNQSQDTAAEIKPCITSDHFANLQAAAYGDEELQARIEKIKETYDIVEHDDPRAKHAHNLSAQLLYPYKINPVTNVQTALARRGFKRGELITIAASLKSGYKTNFAAEEQRRESSLTIDSTSTEIRTRDPLSTQHPYYKENSGTYMRLGPRRERRKKWKKKDEETKPKVSGLLKSLLSKNTEKG